MFIVGLRHLIRRVHPDYEWLSALVFGSGLVQAAGVLLFDALAGGAALDTFNKPDPIVVRALTEASLANQAFGFILTALFLAAVSYAILATRALPRWTGWVGVGVAVLNLAAVPAIFGGNDFMEAVIAGVTTSAGVYAYINDVRGLAYIGWLLIVGISMMRVKQEAMVPPTNPAMEPAWASREVGTGKGNGSVQASGEIEPEEIIGETGFNPQADSTHEIGT